MKTFKILREELFVNLIEGIAPSSSELDLHQSNKLKDLSDDEHKTFNDYRSSWNEENRKPESALINGWLKHNYDNRYKGYRYTHPDQNPSEKIEKMDGVLNRHKTDRDMDLYTGIRGKPKTDENGHAHLPGYTSTTLDQHVAADFAMAKSNTNTIHILHIKLPAGSHAASLHHVGRRSNDKDDHHEYDNENEILMARGHTIKINPKPTIYKDMDDIKHHIWHATVVNHDPKNIIENKINEKIKLLTQSYLTIHDGTKEKKIQLISKSNDTTKEKQIPMLDTFFGKREE